MGDERVGRIAAGRGGRTAAAVVSIRDFARPARAPQREDDRRGVLLLFTGVRYERQIEPADPVAGKGRRPRRGRR